MALTGTKALMVWCQQVTNGYKDVNIRNMTSAWRDGLGFCAILHHYRPDLINFDKLSKENIAENNHLAFSVAENDLGIPALLDVEDMVAMEVPDKLSIMTYVSQYFNYFRDKVPGEIPPISRHSTKRQSPFTTDDLPKKKAAPGISAVKEVIGSTPVPKMNKGTMDKYCAKCKETVYLMERFQVEGKLFHRVCFKCATCGIQLRMGTYRYIPIEDQFYCDSHYRKRTTSTSSDELRTSARAENQKSEQDALHSLLQSLENKRKASEMSQEENGLKPSASLHERIGNARKMFMQAEQSSTGSEGESKSSDSNNVTPKHCSKPPSKQPPQRPSTPPKLETKEVKDKELFQKSKLHDNDRTESRSTEHIPSRPLFSPVKKMHRSCDDLAISQHKAPPRPPNLPNRQCSDNVADARGFLSSVLPTFQDTKNEQTAPSYTQDVADDNGGHIYEMPFLGASKEKDDPAAGEFENPRYGDKINMNPSVVYANEGSSLLTLKNKKMQDEEDQIMEEENELSPSHVCVSKDVDRARTDSVASSCSEGERKKKMVLKVKKKRQKDKHEQGESMNLDEYSDEKMIENDATTNVIEKQEGDVVTELSNAPVEKTSDLGDINIDHAGQQEKKSDENQSEKDDKFEEMDEIENVKSYDEKVELGHVSSDTGGKSDASINQESMNTLSESENQIKDSPNVADLPSNIAENEKAEIQETLDTNALRNTEVSSDIGPEGVNDQEEFEKPELNSDATSHQEVPGDHINRKDDDPGDKNIESVSHDSKGTVLEKAAGSHNVLLNESKEHIIVDSSKNSPREKTKVRVVKYRNPFEDSDDEILNDQQKVSLNPFEVMSDEDEIVGTVNISPGEGPKIRISPKEIEQHEKKISDLKKAKFDKKKKVEKYRNPFEDSDDDILDEDATGQAAKPKQAKNDERSHQKKLVLKKKKRQAPPKPDMVEVPAEKGPGPSLSSTEKKSNEITEQLNATSNPAEISKDECVDENMMKTFKTYVENSKIELNKDKRLDNRPPERRKHSLGKGKDVAQSDNGMTSPVSSSCPSLIENENQDNIAIESVDRPVSTEEIAKTSFDVDQKKLADENGARTSPVVKKEKPPKRPAPPVPSGVKPFSEKPPETKPFGTVEQSDDNLSNNRDVIKEKQNIGKDDKKGNEDKDDKNKELKGKKDEKKEQMKKKKEDVKKNEKQKEEKKKGEKKKDEKKLNKKQPKNKKKELNKKVSKEEKKNEIAENKSKIEEQEIYFIEDQEYTQEEISAELKSIESKQRVLEKKGVQMEKKLREQLHGEPEENYMVTWFDLITEKNKLLRRENELIYMSQEMEYHENQRRIEYELRLLMEKDESVKTDEDRQAEEQLLQQLVNYVSRRNKIVEKMEEDRIREKEEDQQIQMVMMAQGLAKSKKKKAGKKNSSSTTFYD